MAVQSRYTTIRYTVDPDVMQVKLCPPLNEVNTYTKIIFIFLIMVQQ